MPINPQPSNLDLLKLMLDSSVARDKSLQDTAELKQSKDRQVSDQNFQLRKGQEEHQLKEQGAKNRLQQVLEAMKSGQIPEGAGISVGPEAASISRQPNLGVYDLKKDQFDRKQANAYSKGLEKYSDLHGAAQDLERITDRDGKGGVFTNPSAQLVSSGKVVSAIPDAGLGLAELTHIAPEGSAEERKALARYKLAMGHALTGARMNPTMQKMIQDSLGGMASGDPQLMSKGLRGSARILGGTIKTVQGGFSPEVRGMVHDQMGGDPMDFYGRIPSENSPPSNYNSPPAGSTHTQRQKTQAAPPGMPAQPPQNPASMFDPDSYLKGNQ